MPFRMFLIFCTIITLYSCSSSPSTGPTKLPSDQTGQSEPSTLSSTALEWLRVQPFKTAPDTPPNIVLTKLPEGFRVEGTEMGASQLPNGERTLRITVTYEKPIEGKVYVENSVQIEFYSYQSVDGRSSHLGMLSEQGYQWSFAEINNQKLARYSNGVDGLVWVSGPYLIVIYSDLDVSEQAPWVETFGELYLELFPSEGD
jgi:hypothetical protein